eukprot:8401053-Alexandrium_andersonii.AAC.1
MSASLVGSEMCIRDREKDTASRAEQRHASEQQALQPMDADNSALRIKHCLLYTSDAADDM